MANTRFTFAGPLMATLLVTGLFMGALPDPTPAAVTCPTTSTTDSDGDGLTDTQECAGLTFVTANPLIPNPLPWCGASGAAKPNCVDPNSKDVFVVIVPAVPSLMPTPIPQSGFDPFALFGTLGITAHPVLSTQLVNNLGGADDRALITTPATTVKAVRVTESLDTNGTILGVCNQGTPQNLDGCVVYTQRILNFINSTCDSAGDTTTDRQAVFKQYVLHTIVHETGHSLGGLTTQYNSNYGGNHYKTGAGYFMHQSVKYTTKAGTCTFTVYQNWNLTLDPPGVKLQ
jgi:hypothetical protein